MGHCIVTADLRFQIYDYSALWVFDGYRYVDSVWQCYVRTTQQRIDERNELFGPYCLKLSPGFGLYLLKARLNSLNSAIRCSLSGSDNTLHSVPEQRPYFLNLHKTVTIKREVPFYQLSNRFSYRYRDFSPLAGRNDMPG